MQGLNLDSGGDEPPEKIPKLNWSAANAQGVLLPKTRKWQRKIKGRVVIDETRNQFFLPPQESVLVGGLGARSVGPPGTTSNVPYTAPATVQSYITGHSGMSADLDSMSVHVHDVAPLAMLRLLILFTVQPPAEKVKGSCPRLI